MRRRLAASLSAVSLASVAGLSSASLLSARPEVVTLASSAAAPRRPTCVLVHGLDSSKETFSGTIALLAKIGYPAIALDLRGHGESPFGSEADFSAEALATDVLTAVHSIAPDGAVLLGHSMGGRVAMRAAALDAASTQPVLRSVIIEDMDVSVRTKWGPRPLTSAEEDVIMCFSGEDGRRFSSWEAARAALAAWYDSARVDAWRGKRVRELPDGNWWSDINPAAQRLAGERILASDDAARAWKDLSSAAAPPTCRYHVWYADEPGTVVSLEGPGSIAEMRDQLPGAEFRFFAGAGHSIHNDKPTEFVEALRAVIDEAANRTAKPGTTIRGLRGG